MSASTWKPRARRAARRALGRALLCAILWALSLALAHASVELDAAGALLSPGGLTLGSAALAGLFVLTRLGLGAAVIGTAAWLPVELIGALWPKPPEPEGTGRATELEPWRSPAPGRFEAPPRASDRAPEPAWRADPSEAPEEE